MPGHRLGEFSSVLIVFAALLTQLLAGQWVGREPTASPSSEMVAAIANKTLIKTPPHFLQEPSNIRPESAAQEGAYGELVLSGIIGADGRLHEAKVAQSSRSAILDAAALAAVPTMLFEPAKDGAGKPLSIPADLPLEYPATDFHGPRGLAQYKCAQFVRDYDWWSRTWGAEKQDRVYKTLRGFAAVNDLRSGKSIDFATEWKEAAERCRSAPNGMMLNMLTPHGTLFRGLAAH